MERFLPYQTDFNEMVEDVNEKVSTTLLSYLATRVGSADAKHVEAWSRMLAASNPPIDSSPLSPFLDAHAFRSEFY